MLRLRHTINCAFLNIPNQSGEATPLDKLERRIAYACPDPLFGRRTEIPFVHLFRLNPAAGANDPQSETD